MIFKNQQTLMTENLARKPGQKSKHKDFNLWN